MSRAALVTGAGTGIGAGIARRLDDDGWEVYATGRTEAALEKMADGRSTIHVVTGDINEPEHRRDLVERITRQHPDGLSVLVNNAGVGMFGPLERLDTAAITQMIATNLASPIFLTQGLVPLLQKAEGTVINISSASAAGTRAAPENSVYTACKAALDSLTRSWAAEMGPRVRCVGVAPGVTNTGIALRTGMPPEVYEQFLAAMSEKAPSGRVGDVDDVVALVMALIHPELHYINGTTLTIDGALSVT